VVELDGYFGAMPMNNLNQLTHARKELIITDSQLVFESPPLQMNIGGFDDN